MEEEVEGKWAEVEERRNQSPVLPDFVRISMSTMLHPSSYLVLHKHSPEAVEELEWRNDVTLNEYRCDYCGRSPVPRTGGHFVKPLFQRKLSDRSSSACPTEHIIHVH